MRNPNSNPNSNPNPNPKVYRLSSFNQSHGSKDSRFLLWLVKYDQFLGTSSLDLDLSFEFSFKDPRSYRLNITFVSFSLNGKLEEIGTVNGAMFQMCNGSFQGKIVEIYWKKEDTVPIAEMLGGKNNISAVGSVRRSFP